MRIDRAGAICDLWCHAYYSCLPTSLSVWQLTSDMIEVAWELEMEMTSLQAGIVMGCENYPHCLILLLSTTIVSKMISSRASLRDERQPPKTFFAFKLTMQIDTFIYGLNPSNSSQHTKLPNHKNCFINNSFRHF